MFRSLLQDNIREIKNKISTQQKTKITVSNQENKAKLYKLDLENQGTSQKGKFGNRSNFSGGNFNFSGSNFKRYDQGNILFSCLNKPIYKPKPCIPDNKDTKLLKEQMIG